MFRIKICGLTNAADARAAVDAGADAIGINFFRKSRRFVETGAAREIALAVPAGVLKVGVFVNHSTDEITQIVGEVGLDVVQLHGDESPSLLAQLPRHVRIVRAYRCGQEGLAPLREYLDKCQAAGRGVDAVLIDAAAAAEYGGTGQLADWARIARERDWVGAIPLILAGGLTPGNVAAAIKVVRPDGVDVASGVENRPGGKDAMLVSKFVAVARGAFAGNKT